MTSAEEIKSYDWCIRTLLTLQGVYTHIGVWQVSVAGILKTVKSTIWCPPWVSRHVST